MWAMVMYFVIIVEKIETWFVACCACMYSDLECLCGFCGISTHSCNAIITQYSPYKIPRKDLN